MLEDSPDPAPGPGEVRVRTTAVGVNYADCVVRMGLYASAKEYVGWPITPGFEFSGVVEAIGDDAPVSVGSEVCGVTRFGGYASHVVVPAAQVFELPGGWSAVEAAGFPAVSLTAWYALHELVRLRPGMSVLVHSAAGGVGGALCRLARAADARVLGVVGSGTKLDAARRNGADEVVDKSSEDLWAGARRFAPAGFDVVLDANGPSTLRRSYAHLGAEGKLVVYGFHSMLPRQGGRPGRLRLVWGWLRTPRFNPIDLTGANKSVLGFNLSYLFEREDLLRRAMDALGDLANRGALPPPEVKTYPLEDVGKAHRDLESGRTIGKLVLIPEPA